MTLMEPLVVPWRGKPTESELVNFVGGVVDQLQTPLLQLAFRIARDWHAAQDVVQEAFAALCEALRANTIRGDVGHWLTRVTHNKAVDHVRRAALEAEKAAIVAQDEAIDDPSPDAEERFELCQLALRHMAELPDRERAVVQMRFLEQKGFDKIAAALGTQPQTVRNQCQQAIARLRGLLDGNPLGELSARNTLGPGDLRRE